KCDRRGALDALRDVKKQWRRNRAAFELPEREVPVFACVASRFNDSGVDRLYAALRARLPGVTARANESFEQAAELARSAPLIPETRGSYLAEIAASVRGYRTRVSQQAEVAARCDALARALHELDHASLQPSAAELQALRARHADLAGQLDP